MMGFGWGTMGVLGIASMMVFWVVVVIAGIWLLSRLFPQVKEPSQTYPPADSAFEILRQRYARGEITQAEYQEMQQNLER